jgi:hypothetical protein
MNAAEPRAERVSEPCGAVEHVSNLNGTGKVSKLNGEVSGVSDISPSPSACWLGVGVSVRLRRGYVCGIGDRAIGG